MQASFSTAKQCHSTPGRRPLRSSAPHRARSRRPAVTVQAALKAIIFDCDGVLLESEDLHRRAYNAAFQNFGVTCDSTQGVVDWSIAFYDVLQNKVGGGKPKMRWYFGENGWPTSTVLDGKAPTNDEERALLIDTLQDWKTDKYMNLIGSGEVEPRPGVLRLMDEAREAGLKLAVCSAATKASVVFTVPSLIGQARFEALDVFLAGDDVPKIKPDPTIYRVAAERMGVQPSECIVIEDSMVGLQAALGAGMRCIITYTSSTAAQGFAGAYKVVSELGDNPPQVTAQGLQSEFLTSEPSDSRLAVGA